MYLKSIDGQITNVSPNGSTRGKAVRLGVHRLSPMSQEPKPQLALALIRFQRRRTEHYRGDQPWPPATPRRTAPSLPARGGCARSASGQRLDRDVLANLVAELEADSDGLGRPFDAKFATTALGALYVCGTFRAMIMKSGSEGAASASW